MIVITGAAGFIGSCLAAHLNACGYHDLVLVDDFSRADKEPNLKDKVFSEKVERTRLAEWINENHKCIQFIFHLGARTDTTETNTAIFDELNLHYSQMVWQCCVQFGIPLVYASSAATYGSGELGYSDATPPEQLCPLNPYGVSKNDFDTWALQQNTKPYFWAGLKFFNVYGPNEYHKGRMASVVYHAYKQIQETGGMRLFQSHKPNVKDGEQQRDFIYVKDLVKVCQFFMETRKNSGLYNLGTGKSETFLHLVESVFSALGKQPNITFIPTPEDIRNTYQYYTCADMQHLRLAGYQAPFVSLESGIQEYVQQYLIGNKYF